MTGEANNASDADFNVCDSPQPLTDQWCVTANVYNAHYRQMSVQRMKMTMMMMGTCLMTRGNLLNIFAFA